MAQQGDPEQGKPQRTGRQDETKHDQDREMKKQPRQGGEQEGQKPDREQRGGSGGGNR